MNMPIDTVSNLKRELRVVTINIWQPEDFNLWPQRLDAMVNELQTKKFCNDGTSDVVIALQEVLSYKNTNPAYAIAQRLGFSENQVHFFPTRTNGKTGVAFITNLPVMRAANKSIDRTIHYDPDTIPDVNRRNVGLLEVQRNGKPLVLAVTHLTYETENNKQAKEAELCLSEVYRFAVDTLIKQGIIFDTPQCVTLDTLEKNIGVIVCGDYNADAMTEAYRLFSESGLQEWTKPLRETTKVSWPVDIPWLKGMIQKKDNEGKMFDYESIQRWMDYIFGIGMKPSEVYLLGTEPVYLELGQKIQTKMYPSDHIFPAVFFR